MHPTDNPSFRRIHGRIDISCADSIGSNWKYMKIADMSATAAAVQERSDATSVFAYLSPTKGTCSLALRYLLSEAI